MYDDYLALVRRTIQGDIRSSNFKSEAIYRCILEHVTEGFGKQYLELIQNEFPDVKTQDVIDFAGMNDSVGNPIKASFAVSDGTTILCSPSSLRYIYHSLIILDTIKNHPKNNVFKQIVELGCGYGGLFMALNYFRERYFGDVCIEHYYLMDMPDVIMLIDKYLKAYDNIPLIRYTLVDTFTFGEGTIQVDNESDLFFISNYCLTELVSDLRKKYYSLLLPKCAGGFIVWQTLITPLAEQEELALSPYRVEEERPQTSPGPPNFFVRF